MTDQIHVTNLHFSLDQFSGRYLTQRLQRYCKVTINTNIPSPVIKVVTDKIFKRLIDRYL